MGNLLALSQDCSLMANIVLHVRKIFDKCTDVEKMFYIQYITGLKSLKIDIGKYILKIFS